MTNAEVLKYLIGSGGDVSSDRINKTLSLSGFDPDDDYDLNDKCKLTGLAIDEIQNTINSGVKSVSQGDYSITYDTEAAKEKMKWLASSSDCPGLIDKVSDIGQPVIRDKSNLW